MEKEIVTFCVTPYALADVLLALHNNNVKEIYVTKCDNDLYIRIPKERIERAVYPIKENICECGEVCNDRTRNC